MTNLHKSMYKFLKQASDATLLVTNNLIKYRFHVVSVVGTCTTLYLLFKNYQTRQLEIKTTIKRRSSERRFIELASVAYHGQIFMTPLDFLESLMELEPRRRHNRRQLTEENLEEIQNNTPQVEESSKNFFRNLRDEGIISYSEYLFLMSILIQPQPQTFDISFKMLDTNNNGTIDKNEFRVMEKIISENLKRRKGLNVKQSESYEENLEDDDDGLQKKHVVNTSLTVHFFGKHGSEALSYKNFKKFMLDFQREVLELEFAQFSHGLSVITEADFAKILLRYTNLEQEEHDEYIDRLLDRIEKDKSGAHPGITFEEFSSFMNFLHNLNEFRLTTKFYTLLNTRATISQFQNAVKVCTGQKFTVNLVKTIFNLFGTEGNGTLSYQEFNFIMKDRLHRGFGVFAKKRSFKECVRREMAKHGKRASYKNE